MFDEIITQLPHIFDQISSTLIYFILGLSALLENLIPPIPGDVVTAFGAFLIGTGKLEFWGVYIATTFGSTIGFVLLYFVGKFLGKEIIKKKNILFFKYESIEKAEKWIQKYGIWLVLANRFLPGIRSVISLSAGFSNTSTILTILFSLASASLWNLLILYLGYSLGNNWSIIHTTISELLSMYSRIIFFLVIICIIVFVLYRITQHREYT